MSLNIFSLATLWCDSPERWQCSLQDSATPVMDSMIHFHHYLNLFMWFIATGIVYLLYCIVRDMCLETNTQPIKFSHSSTLEIVWTIIPAILLILIAIPSFNLLYSLDELIDPSITLKIIGHQWYWSYEYSDYAYLTNNESLSYDSYMLNESALTYGAFRLLEVDNRVVLPIKTHIRLLVTAADVLHSWAIPSFGIKIDACPGRLSQVSLFLKRAGVYYGQCSEICGINHGFMPIVVHGVSEPKFTAWVISKLNTLD